MSTDQGIERSSRLAWFKSSYSGTSGGDCVEVSVGVGAIYVRDSKAVVGGPVLRVGPDEWTAFVTHASGAWRAAT